MLGLSIVNSCANSAWSQPVGSKINFLMSVNYANNLFIMGIFANSTLQNKKIIPIFAHENSYKWLSLSI